MVSVSLINVSGRRFYNDVENLSLAGIAAFLRNNGVKVSLLHMDSFIKEETEIEKIPLTDQLIGFSLYHLNAEYIFSMAKLIKSRNPKALVCVGGQLAADAADIILNDCPAIDFVVLGDGEYPMLEVSKAVENNESIVEIQGISVRGQKTSKTAVRTPIHEMPLPARDYIPMAQQRNNSMARINASRGCCAHCTFCSTNSFRSYCGKKWEGRDIDEVFDEVVSLNRQFGTKFFVFNDASFEDPGEMGKNRIERFCQRLIDYPVQMSFRSFLRAETFREKDIPLIKLMKKAGFYDVFLGIESFSSKDLKFFKKKADADDNIRAIRIFTENGIDVQMGFIMLHPFTDKETLKTNYDFLKNLSTYRVANYTNRIEVYYNTQMHREIAELGLLTDQYSYLRPDEIKFKDPYVAELDEFLMEMAKKSALVPEDYRFAHFVHTFNSLCPLYPEETEKYRPRIQALKDKLAKELAAYFEKIFSRFDIEEAKAGFGDFEEKMMQIYSQTRMFSLRLVSREPFREYFFNSDFDGKRNDYVG